MRLHLVLRVVVRILLRIFERRLAIAWARGMGPEVAGVIPGLRQSPAPYAATTKRPVRDRSQIRTARDTERIPSALLTRASSSNLSGLAFGSISFSCRRSYSGRLRRVEGDTETVLLLSSGCWLLDCDVSSRISLDSALLIGAPGSGKSSRAKRHCTVIELVSHRTFRLILMLTVQKPSRAVNSPYPIDTASCTSPTEV